MSLTIITKHSLASSQNNYIEKQQSFECLDEILRYGITICIKSGLFRQQFLRLLTATFVLQ